MITFSVGFFNLDSTIRTWPGFTVVCVNAFVMFMVFSFLSSMQVIVLLFLSVPVMPSH